MAFVTLKGGQTKSKELNDALKKHVAASIGAIARPDEIRFTDALPKTRSGKIMRRLLKEIAAGKAVTGDTTTLEDLVDPGEAAVERGVKGLCLCPSLLTRRLPCRCASGTWTACARWRPGW